MANPDRVQTQAASEEHTGDENGLVATFEGYGLETLRGLTGADLWPRPAVNPTSQSTHLRRDPSIALVTIPDTPHNRCAPLRGGGLLFPNRTFGLERQGIVCNLKPLGRVVHSGQSLTAGNNPSSTQSTCREPAMSRRLQASEQPRQTSIFARDRWLCRMRTVTYAR